LREIDEKRKKFRQHVDVFQGIIGKQMPKNVKNAGIYSALCISMIIITLSAGCSEEVAPTTITQTPTITSNQPKFGEGDIIAKTTSSPDLFLVILNYDASLDKYERALVHKNSDGSWSRSNNKTEFTDRALIETVYPAKVGQVTSLSQIAIETPSPNTFEPSTASSTPSPSLTPVKTQTQTPQFDPIIGTWTFTNSYEENGSRMNVTCTHQFVSGGEFFHACTGPNEPVQEPDYGQWENRGANAYVIMYPDENNPEQPYGFYEGFYYNLSYNPDVDTLTILAEKANETIVLTRGKNN
jgi:hypothetical protein